VKRQGRSVMRQYEVMISQVGRVAIRLCRGPIPRDTEKRHFSRMTFFPCPMKWSSLLLNRPQVPDEETLSAQHVPVAIHSKPHVTEEVARYCYFFYFSLFFIYLSIL